MTLVHELPEEHVIFNVGRETFALNAIFVKRIEINKHTEKRSIPNSKPEYPGIIIVEDDIVHLYDLRVKFRMHTTDLNTFPFVIVSKLEEENLAVGFIVDHVEDVVKIPHGVKLGKVSEQLTGNTLDFIKGVYRPFRDQPDKHGENGEQIYSILDIGKLIPLQELTNMSSQQE